MRPIGNEHRRLRAALNVGFTPAAVRGYESAFQKAAEMVSGIHSGSRIPTWPFSDFRRVRNVPRDGDRHLSANKSGFTPCNQRRLAFSLGPGILLTSSQPLWVFPTKTWVTNL
jgi:cytochrome P450